MPVFFHLFVLDRKDVFFPEFVKFLRVCDWFGSGDVVVKVTEDKK